MYALKVHLIAVAMTLAEGLWPVALAVGAAGVMLNCPSPHPTPTGTDAASAPNAQDQGVYAKLVDGKCLAPSADGAQAIHDERALPDAPAWLGCLYDGGTVYGCAVPCASATGKPK